ncbi:MAG TPA: hypothetical protein VHP83_09770 [Aggregatilineaceae bacterium]|nr:hypothetical protein [Aggregatilineaceae bacterium]
MKLLLRSLLILVCLQGLVIGAVRWIGQHRTHDIFPMPSPDGCWMDVCFLELTLNAVPDALNANQAIVNAHLPQTQYASVYGTRVEFSYTVDAQMPEPMVLLWASHSYSLVHSDWQLDSSPPLLHVGEMMAQLGKPSGVVRLADTVVLLYRPRNLTVFVEPREMGADWFDLSPDAPVVGMSVANRFVAGYTQDQYAARAHPWRGFRLYRF